MRVLLAAVALTVSLPADEVRRPNIILMMADDMGLGDTSAYQDFTRNTNAEQIHTPAIEMLARMGVRMIDAHTPASRCTPTRYGLLTGRYPWRSRLKWWVLFGAQGDPLIETDRPVLTTMLQHAGYRTAMTGKWHVGLRYQRSESGPAAGFEDADLTRPLFDSPMDHGFDVCWFTSRSHGTSGPEPGRRNTPDQLIGPGHITGRQVIGATSMGRKLNEKGDAAYRLSELGGRNSDNAMSFLSAHVTSAESRSQPFFLYYACHSNHTPHTPDTHVGSVPVAGAGRTVSGQPCDRRGEFIYENDVALRRILDWLQQTEDPRRPGHRLVENTLVIFTSDNGAERNSNTATGPFRSHKGSCFEGGHRVPFIAAWPAGGIGDGNPQTQGRTSSQLLGLTDIYATLANILNVRPPDVESGKTGAEDSLSMLEALTTNQVKDRVLFFSDHKQARDAAVLSMRLDNPVVNDVTWPGQWKIFFDATLIRRCTVNPIELYDLATDPQERNNCLNDPALAPLVQHLSKTALRYRSAGGHRLASETAAHRVTFVWNQEFLPSDNATAHQRVVDVRDIFARTQSADVTVSASELQMRVAGNAPPGRKAPSQFSLNVGGLGLTGGAVRQVDAGERLTLSFNRKVMIESVAVVAGNGSCGGFYTVGNRAPLQIYCTDADIDSKDQSGLMTDLGVLPSGQSLTLDSRPFLGVESPGQWRLGAITVRVLPNN